MDWLNPCLFTGVALLIDYLVGDPPRIPHPVVLIGRWIKCIDESWNQHPSAFVRSRILGSMLTVATVVGAGALTWLILYLLHFVSPWLAILANVWLISTTIAWRGLLKAGQSVQKALQRDGIEAGRAAVAMIVGRDTAHLDEAEVTRACVETLAENIVDAIVSPVVFGCIGGAPLAMAYRAANTLDSMVGYRSARHRHFGWSSARLDDLLNYVPARLTALLLFVAIALCKGHAHRAWRTWRRDAHLHPSPNSGIPESMVAGALGVQLGGQNVYDGVLSNRATMGDATRSLESADIRRTAHLVSAVSWVLFAAALVAAGVWWGFAEGVRPWGA
ncbi:adenosylcobinamide-phosphate synthase CbiB [Alicyclobacillus fastidiosus]|uniref:Cobalamin biosynthesis protein CobD n=1 Tax=Alicyclobacillus fastidiosus TaxID=392011 RepID=A0ABY6ZJA5_9BACL|nr:adenosylcobinamide-phosphate synthase CbiB [Alicyclobacillus fastidiosus]WAH43003.1 adenosylcobinamide-phosphate synthase CbiB [Alicyclobacillus fastidiosus]GMA64973.1 cobalamin biosynthesis protein [Alicyclobacillus fastidiosus]